MYASNRQKIFMMGYKEGSELYRSNGLKIAMLVYCFLPKGYHPRGTFKAGFLEGICSSLHKKMKIIPDKVFEENKRLIEMQDKSFVEERC